MRLTSAAARSPITAGHSNQPRISLLLEDLRIFFHHRQHLAQQEVLVEDVGVDVARDLVEVVLAIDLGDRLVEVERTRGLPVVPVDVPLLDVVPIDEVYDLLGERLYGGLRLEL